ncbi:MAG: outer membrane protein assembly factor [Pseudohongiella sp.]|nr:MAG: outer membrane protein assembly factor [Pseudohongiella sp.]
MLTGASDQLERNLRAHISIPNISCDASQARLRRFVPGIRQDIERAGRALGYYLIQSIVAFEEEGACWSMSIDVIPGAAVMMSNIDVSIRNDARLFSSILEDLPLASGDQLNQQSYEEIKTRLSSRAVEVGFFSARFERSQLLLDLQQNTADASIDFDPGERYRFGEVQIQPIEELSEDFIRRFIDFEDESFYSSSALIGLRSSLNDSQYFSSVSVTPVLNANQGAQVPITVALQPRPRHVYSMGAGVTTDIGPRLTASFEDRFLNPNGHRFDLGSSVSPIEQSFDANYTIPMENPATESLRFSGGFLRENNDTYESNTFKLGSVYSFINESAWRQNYFLNFQHEEFRIEDEDEVADLLIPGISLAKTQADDALYPTRGWRLFGRVRGASTAILSTESFLQLDLQGKWITTIGSGRLLARFDLGTTLVDDSSELPASIRYFAGGDQNVRGYQYQSLGPENDLGEVIGGKHLITAAIEYDFNVRENWKLAVFYDAGNAFNEANDLELKESVGIGLRWLSPIGPIRLDLASALDDDNKLRLHITMGPDL